MGRNPIIPTLLLAFIGLASMSNNAKADVYLYRAYDYGYVKSYYNTWTEYDIYVSSWGNTSTKTEYFNDSIGRRWNLVTTTYDIVPGYSYTGSYYVGTDLRYYRLCGSTYYSATTGCYYYRCKCGRTFVYVP
jgi:hypothetical protein